MCRQFDSGLRQLHKFILVFARVAQWWSVALPRRRSRVRSPSRAFFISMRSSVFRTPLYVLSGDRTRSRVRLRSAPVGAEQASTGRLAPPSRAFLRAATRSVIFKGLGFSQQAYRWKNIHLCTACPVGNMDGHALLAKLSGIPDNSFYRLRYLNNLS